MHKETELEGLQLLERREKEERWKVIVEGLSHFAALICLLNINLCYSTNVYRITVLVYMHPVTF